MLKFQGIKLSEDDAATAHSHGHLSVGMDDITMCMTQVQETVATCLRRVGVERVMVDETALPLRMSLMGRLGGRRDRAPSKVGADMEDITAWDTPTQAK
jgi:hypothetical protein